MHLDEPIDSPRLYLDRHSPEQPRRLWGLIEESKRDDPLAPATVVGPSNYANLTLRHELARSGFANVRFLPMPRLAELLGAPSLAARGRTPLTSIVESAAIRFDILIRRGPFEAGPERACFDVDGDGVLDSDEEKDWNDAPNYRQDRLILPGNGDTVAEVGEVRFNSCVDVIEDNAEKRHSYLTAYGTLVHEAGHAIGIGGGKSTTHSTIADSAMSRTDNLLCSPHPFDIMAIYALYQTRLVP